MEFSNGPYLRASSNSMMNEVLLVPAREMCDSNDIYLCVI